MDETSITAAGVIDTFPVLLIGVGPKIALVPYLHITAPLDEPTKRRVRHKMLVTAASVAVGLVVLGSCYGSFYISAWGRCRSPAV